MSTRFAFSAQKLKHGLAMVKLVKPSSNDFAVRFGSNGATFYSADKRRIALINVAADEVPDMESGWTSDEYCIPASKMALFDSNLDTVAFSFTESAMIIQASEGKQTRRATVKRRADAMRRRLIPALRWGDLSLVDAGKFEKLLRVVGCSALVRETKTEEEMRVNQVHFHADAECASSNARYHASVANFAGMKLDLSIVGSDIPPIRSFCSKLDGKVGLAQDKNKLYVVDAESDSVIAFGRVAAVKPDFAPPSDEFEIELVLNKEQLLNGLDWAMAALDGTQRLSCNASEGMLKMSNNGEIFSMPVSFKKGSSLCVDLPAKFLRTTVCHTESESVSMKFGHLRVPSVMAISDAEDSEVCIRHYLQAMRGR
jgi:hypothetical protein